MQDQKFRKTVIARALVTAFCGTVSLGMVPQAVAQSSSSLQRVEITGSNIRRAEAETASPVQTITRDDLEKSGRSSVAEFLQTLAVDNAGSVPTTFGNGFAAGGSGISLRGLGVQSTLVLINGRRVAPYGLADDGQKLFADLNVIPLEAVERVEILKDGASAIYGSDAIAGVVNIILRRNFSGTVAKANYGQSRYGDGRDTRASITHGFGDADKGETTVLLNLELNDKKAIYNRDRKGRGQVGKSDGREIGFDKFTTISGVGAGGTGAITSNNAAGSSVTGNVRNPTTLDYYGRSNPAGVGFTRTFPGAACSNFSSIPQGDVGGACLIDASQDYGQIQPEAKTINFFGRAAKQVNANTEVYGELNLYSSDARSQTTPSGVSGSTGFPGGPVSNAAVALGAGHPDNPYFGSTARFRYLAADVGPRVSNTESTFARALAGIKGSYQAWDYDSAFLYSGTKTENNRTGYLQRDVAFALLNPSAANVAAARAGSAAYAALPAGSFWRIAENAGLNSAALYEALSPSIKSEAKTSTAQIDFKASRELGKLDGGPIGLAVGAEFRRESVQLSPTTGTDRGNIIGLGYSAYDGARNVAAIYTEGVFPVTKQIELNAAARVDHYTDVGNSFTPKVGAKWTPVNNFALRGTYAAGFRAPGAAENGKGGLSAFTSAADPLRCTAGVTEACSPLSVALITSPNPALEPEKSKSMNIGAVWDLTPKTSLTADLFEIKRTNEINQESITTAIAAGRVSRDPSTSTRPGDPGAITAVLANYINSAKTTVRGLDLEAKHRFDFGASTGRLTLVGNWTRLFTFLREEQDGSKFDYAGTHGNCDVTNCIGTPKDRINFGATWDVGAWRIAALANFRGSLKNTLFKNDPDGCASHFADGTDAPSGCKVKSFTTVDLTVRWKATQKTEVFGTILNLFDKTPPLDVLTYGAVGYNPLDYRGAVGRFFNIGVRHQF